MWLKRHWRSALGLLSFITLIPKAVKATWEALGFAGDVDFVVTHAQDPGWMGQVVAWLFNPPGWSIIPMIAAGLALIFWDVRRRKIAHPAQKGELPIAIPYIRLKCFWNFAGFYEPICKDDAQIASFGTVSITNLSRTDRVSLEIYLQLEGDPLGPATIPADLRGPLDLMYGTDDFGFKRRREKSGGWMDITLPDVTYFKNPISIAPQSTREAGLVFLFIPFYFDREKVLEFMQKAEPKMSLLIIDLVSGAQTVVSIPGEYRANNPPGAVAAQSPSSQRA